MNIATPVASGTCFNAQKKYWPTNSLLNISRDTVGQQINLSMKHLRKEFAKKILALLHLLALVSTFLQ